MKRDLGWVCDELARLHADLEAIRARRRMEQAAAQAPASTQVDNCASTPTATEAGEAKGD